MDSCVPEDVRPSASTSDSAPPKPDFVDQSGCFRNRAIIASIVAQGTAPGPRHNTADLSRARRHKEIDKHQKSRRKQSRSAPCAGSADFDEQLHLGFSSLCSFSVNELMRG
jgi:hypothetical protein